MSSQRISTDTITNIDMEKMH